jgi:outer membrane protein OmpA-like peptidoglycan-associated protein
VIGYKRSNDPADIKEAELTDAPGGSGDFDFDFETVAKGEDTMTIFGSLKWGFQLRSGQIQNDHASATEGQSATFDAALERHRDFYVHEPVIFYFDFDSRTLNATELAKIDTFVAYLQRNPTVTVTPSGFADQRGGQSQYNLNLSFDRANAVASALRAKGVAESQLSGVVIGNSATTDFSQDASTDQDREGNRQANRRVVLTFSKPDPSAAGATSSSGSSSSTP